MSDNEDEEEQYEEEVEENEYEYEEEGEDDYEDFNTTSNSVDKSFDFSSPNGKSNGKKATNFKIVDFLEVKSVIDSNVADLTSLLDCDQNCAQFLLHFYNWDKEKIIESFFADPAKVKAASGVDLYDPDQIRKYFEVTVKNTIANTIKSKAKPTCRVCYDELTDVNKEGFSLGCGHLFCKDCFGAYLHGQVTDGPNCVIAHCPEFKCKQAITQDVFHAFLSADDKENYNRYVLRRYIECCKTMRYCPAPNCEKVAMASGQTNICCECTFCYCFDCGEETHDPASCSQLAKWIEKCASDGESAKWIFANTKKCPKCFTRIEKNQGCNHMTCRSATCTHQFCWICMGNWAGHTNCNRYNTEEVTTEQNAIQRAKAELDRYLHYYNRYQAHDLALRIANKQRATAELRMKERQDRKSDAWIDVQFIHEAVEQVIACRRVLKYTYVIGFYMPENSPEKLLFERHQEMLEENTEKLHECTEQKNVFLIDRTQVVNWTRITEKFRNAILDNFMDGHMLGGGENSAAGATNVFDDFGSNGKANTSSNSSSNGKAGKGKKGK